MTILTKKYKFIRDDIYISPWVNTETGKQKVILEKIGKRQGKLGESDEILYYEEIKCVHAAIIDSTIEDRQTIFISSNEEIESLSIKSSENVDSFNISPEEKYFALNSWVSGLSEMGEHALKLQENIEKAGNIVYSISFRLLMFLAHADAEYILKYIKKIGNDCIFEGKVHDPCLIANLTPILEMVIYNTEHRLHYFHANYHVDAESILSEIFDLHPPIELLSKNLELMHLLEHPEAIKLNGFKKGFHDEDSAVRMAILNNPNSTGFDEFKKFLSFETEKGDSIRMMAANRESALKFSEFKNLCDENKEPNERVREASKSMVNRLE